MPDLLKNYCCLSPMGKVIQVPLISGSSSKMSADQRGMLFHRHPNLAEQILILRLFHSDPHPPTQALYPKHRSSNSSYACTRMAPCFHVPKNRMASKRWACLTYQSGPRFKWDMIGERVRWHRLSGAREPDRGRIRFYHITLTWNRDITIRYM
jgi:hypothetical protein